MLPLILSACAPLSYHESGWGDAGEIAGRTLLCPITLCLSEFVFYGEYKNEQRREAYANWYQQLSPAERDREDRRRADAMNALGMALMGGGPRFQTYQPVPLPIQSVPMPYQAPRTCTAVINGDYIYTQCP